MPPYVPGYTMVGIVGIPPMYPGIPWWVYTTLYTVHPVPPWVYHRMSCTPSTSALATSLPDNEALGSKKEISLGESLSAALRTSKVLRLIGDSAQSYSALPC